MRKKRRKNKGKERKTSKERERPFIASLRDDYVAKIKVRKT